MPQSIVDSHPHVGLEFTPTIAVKVTHALNEPTDPKTQRSSNSESQIHLPSVGDEFLGFDLIEELGRGSFGCVYLARQRGLSDRPVALKISVGTDAEAQNLARLQHANIVPIYSTHRLGSTYAVCMPYFGRTTLADLCTSLDSFKEAPETGRVLFDTVTCCECRRQTESVQGSTKSPSPSVINSQADLIAAPSSPPIQPIFDKLNSMSFVDAVLWLVHGIAEGLAHAHERGIIHRDLKPANILISDDGQPMILDFNLAMDALENAPSLGGGTLLYMSPEQLRQTAGKGGNIDARSDLYSLGILFAQLLLRKYPFPNRQGNSTSSLRDLLTQPVAPLPAFRTVNRAISPTVEAIVRKCLAIEPSERYQSARDLIEDLELHGAHRPVRHAPNPSLIERGAKWVRRHPKLTSPASLAALATALLLAIVVVYSALSVSAKRAEVAQNADRGRVLVNEFESQLGTARQYLTSHNGTPELLMRGREAGFRALRALIDPTVGGLENRLEFQHLPDEEKTRLATQGAELMFLMGQTTNGDSELDSKFWKRLQQLLPAVKSSPTVRASELHANGKFLESIPELERWTREQPDDANGWFLYARALAETERYDDAYLAYSAAIALRPRAAVGYYFRAALADQLKKADALGRPQALLDTERAVELDPNFVEARFMRAQLRAKLKMWKEAEADLDTIIEQNDPLLRALFLRSKVRMALGKKTAADADFAEGLKREPLSAIDAIARGTARMERDPKAALEDFKIAEKLDPRNLAVLEHRAYLEAELMHRPELAVATLGRLIERNPNSPAIRISRAVYLARVGNVKEAIAEAKKALELSDSPGVKYRVACVFALATPSDPKLAPAAMNYLFQSLKAGFGFEYLADDADLNALRQRPDFSRLAELAKLLQSAGAAK